MKTSLILIASCMIMGCATVQKHTVPLCNELSVGIEDGCGNVCEGFNTTQMGMIYYYVPVTK